MSRLKDRLNKIYNREAESESKSNLRKQLNRIYRKKNRTLDNNQKAGPNLQELVDQLNGDRVGSGDQEIITVSNQYDMRELYGEINLREIYNYNQSDYQKYLNIEKIKYR